MTKEQAARNIALAEALESGKYQQGTGQLRLGDRFCCLGVACDLFNSNGWDGNGNKYAAKINIPPFQVKQYYGWDWDVPNIPLDGRLQPADEANDDGATFPEIAKGFRALAAQALEAK